MRGTKHYFDEEANREQAARQAKEQETYNYEELDPSTKGLIAFREGGEAGLEKFLNEQRAKAEARKAEK